MERMGWREDRSGQDFLELPLAAFNSVSRDGFHQFVGNEFSFFVAVGQT
jgi:hypothetical protein